MSQRFHERHLLPSSATQGCPPGQPREGERQPSHARTSAALPARKHRTEAPKASVSEQSPHQRPHGGGPKAGRGRQAGHTWAKCAVLASCAMGRNNVPGKSPLMGLDGLAAQAGFCIFNVEM